MTAPAAPTDPFWLAGSTVGCLLVHGFSGTPREVRGLGDYLHTTRGVTVSGVQLAGHSGDPDVLRTVRWRDWLQSVELGYAALQERCSHIMVVGLSLGGALALIMARNRRIDRLVLLATPLWIQGDWRINLLPVLRYVQPWYYPLEHADLNDPFIQYRIRQEAPDVDLDDPAVQRQIRQSVRIPVGAIDELRQAVGYARARVPFVRIPTLIMHGHDDDLADPQCAEELFQRLGAPEKELVWWEHTGHQMLVTGPHIQAVYERIAAFVDPLCPDATAPA